MALIRANLVISGRVQGVYYRASAQQEGQRLGLKGWVRNLANGDVEAEVEGEEETVEAFVKWCWKGPSQARVTDVKVRKSAHRGEFGSFEVAR